MVPLNRSYGPTAPNGWPASTGVRDFTSIRTTSALAGIATRSAATSVRRIMGTSGRQYTRGVYGRSEDAVYLCAPQDGLNRDVPDAIADLCRLAHPCAIAAGRCGRRRRRASGTAA